MIKTKLTYCLILLLPVFFAGSGQGLSAQSKDTVSLISYKKVNLCDREVGNVPYKDRIQIGVSLGKVTKDDSLLSYDLQTSHNNDLIYFDTYLYMNTLSEPLFSNEFLTFSFDNENGFVEAHAGRVNFKTLFDPLYGNKPIIAFQGDYLGSCPDTSLVTINYIDFNQEFTREINGYKPAEVISYIEPLPDNFLKFEATSDSLEFDSLDVNYLKIAVSKSEQEFLNKFRLIVDKPEGNFNIEDVNIEQNAVILISQEDTKSSFIYDFEVSGDLTGEEIAELKIVTLENKDDIQKVRVSGIVLDDCSCISNVLDDSFYLKSNEKINVSIKDTPERNINAYFTSGGDEIKVESDGYVLKRITVYNSAGEEIADVFSDGTEKITIPMHRIANTMYLCQIITTENKIVNKFLIK